MTERLGPANGPSDPELLLAHRNVELAREDLEVKLRDLGQAGRRIWTRVGRRARPFLIGGAIAVGALLLIRAARAGSRARRTGDWLPPRAPSLLRLAVGAGVGVVMRSVTTSLVQKAAERLEPALDRERSQHS